GKLFQTLTRVPLQHLPFAGAQPALSALLEGTADLMFDNVASALPHVRAGRLKAIGVTSTTALPMLPGVPVLSESVRGLALTTWFGLFSTAGISDAQATHWANAFAQTLQKPTVQQYAMGVIREDLRLRDFAQLVRADHRFYGQFLKDSQLLP
ncbi:MAG: tripartite tricarboxylate transporter substrate-binding protein, partial [Comamonas sp.]